MSKKCGVKFSTLIGYIVKNTSYERKDVAKILIESAAIIDRETKNGRSVQYGELGTFMIIDRKIKALRDPITGERIVQPSQKVLTLKQRKSSEPEKILKSRMIVKKLRQMGYRVKTVHNGSVEAAPYIENKQGRPTFIMQKTPYNLDFKYSDVIKAINGNFLDMGQYFESEC